MFKNLFKFLDLNQREVDKLGKTVALVNVSESKYKKLKDLDFGKETEKLKNIVTKDEKLENVLPDAFALAREASLRILGQRHYDVQLMAATALFEGKIVEQKTGEGKTLSAVPALYLRALTGKGVHLVTVNDFLARLGAGWNAPVFALLELSVGVIVQENKSFIYDPKFSDDSHGDERLAHLKPCSRKEAYACDVTYGTNNEFGFDYLRDNMVQRVEQMSQRELNYAIVDEVDSILIDEARTPLIISAPDSESTKLYQQFSKVVPRLKEHQDYEIDEKMKAVTLTEQGILKVEEILGVGNIYEVGKINYVHHLEQSLKANFIFKADRDYVVKDGEVIIVDDFTGRLMQGRRYSDGLHQAIEAKEGVEVQKESRTLAMITFQNYFRMYNKLSGMTGTATTSAEEFFKVYKLDTMEIPTNKHLVRKDLADVVYKTEEGKFRAIAEKIKEINKIGQPVLVGTIAIEKSEYLSALLEREGIKHSVLNAKQHEKEALIISNAGQKGAVTIATNMAGRGTDIKLGEGVKDVGGLYIIGSERHEARRIDNQLRGRAGRQGDPGVSQFYVSLEDELMRRFGGDKLKGLMDKLGLPEDQPIENGIISKTIENAQSKIEGYNFDIRKHVLEYDDIMNKQREVIYKKRKEILEIKDAKNEIFNYIGEEIEQIVSAHCIDDEYNWDIEKIALDVSDIFPFSKEDGVSIKEIQNDKSKTEIEKKTLLTEYIVGRAKNLYGTKEKEMGVETMRKIEKMIILQTIDTLWMNHLDEIDYLRQGIGLRGYGQRDPLVEYKREAFNLFSHLVENIRSTIVRTIFKVSSVSAQEENKTPPEQKNLNYSGGEYVKQFGAMEEKSENKKDAPKSKPIVKDETVGRNDPCPCGSGKKYKKCCGK
ncbi:MAG TPA: preprotein translocase subunit SecA [Candidatus Moranbacteria bacterium]|nr:preprotein translocase subunit SecA [Candidatus Moranbacteria bacterium]